MADPLEETSLKHRLFIFDVEGTLIDCVRQTLICWRDAFASCGYAFSAGELHRYSGRDPGRDAPHLASACGGRTAWQTIERRPGSLLPGALFGDGSVFSGLEAAGCAAVYPDPSAMLKACMKLPTGAERSRAAP
jgi:hypothetical protein